MDYTESEEVFKMSHGEQKIDLIYITDIIAGFTHLSELLASDIGLDDEYVLTSGKQTTPKELAQLFCDVSGRKLNTEWGGKAYQDREIMVPWKGTLLLRWSVQVPVLECVKKFVGGGSVFRLLASESCSEAA